MKDKFRNVLDNHSTGMAILIIVLTFLLILGIAFGGMCFEAWLVMLLWNGVVCAIFTSVNSIGFWTAFGLLILCHILFSGVKHCIHSKD